MTIFTAQNILKAYYDCRKTKRATVNALKFELDLENNLAELKTILIDHTYRPGRSICFVVIAPKPREIFAAEFTDRVVHHVLINEVQDIWEKGIFIEDSYACREDKGHHFGAARVAEFVKNYDFYGQFDIRSFFSRISKSILYEIFLKVITAQPKPSWWKNEVLWLTETIVFNDPTKNYIYKGDPALKKLVPTGKSLFDQERDIGMPIGNLTSQFLANVYLNELDHFVKDNLGCPAYARYVDDFLVFSNLKEEIKTWRGLINRFLQVRLRLKLHPSKQQIQPTRHGVPFVGYFIKPWGVTVRRNVVKMAKNKIYRFNHEMKVEKAVESLNSYFGHFGKAQSANLRKHLIERHLSPSLRKAVKVIGGYYHHLRINRSFPPSLRSSSWLVPHPFRSLSSQRTLGSSSLISNSKRSDLIAP